MKKTLITGFEPFHGEHENSSEILINHLQKRNLKEPLYTAILPISYKRCFDIWLNCYKETQPSRVWAFGQAQSRSKIYIETVARNWKAASIADNDGISFNGELIDSHKDEQIFTSMPAVEICQQFSPLEIEISSHAGTFVCNTLMFQIFDFCKAHEVPCGFIHLPLLSEGSFQTEKSSFPLLKALNIINAILN